MTPTSWNCAFCGRNNGKRSKEHLWPRALSRRVSQQWAMQKSIFWLRKIDKGVSKEPEIRDVCAECNNGPLSELDSYICTFYDAYLARTYEEGEVVSVSIDYDRLLRWLLKLCFNSSRIHQKDEFVFKSLRQYILGSAPTPETPMLFVQLVPPGMIPDVDFRRIPKHLGLDRTFYPVGNRVGFLMYESMDGRRKILRAVHLRAFSFFVAFFDPKNGSKSQSGFLRVFTSECPEAQFVRPGTSMLTMHCTGPDAWSSYRHSQIEME